MRIALLLFGRINKFNEHYDHLLDVIGREHNVDIFYSSDYEPPEKIAAFIELYKPVKIVNERIIHANTFAAYPGRLSDTNNETLYNLGCQQINKMRVFMLLEEHKKATNTEYSVVICTRIDLKYYRMNL